MKHFVVAKHPCEDPAHVLFHIEAENVQKAAEWICSQAQVTEETDTEPAKVIIPESLLQKEDDEGETCYTYRRDDIPIIDTSSPDVEWMRTLYIIEVPSVSIP